MCYINEKLRIENVQSINEPEMAKNRKYNEADQDGFILASGNEGNININKDNSVTGITLSVGSRAETKLKFSNSKSKSKFAQKPSKFRLSKSKSKFAQKPSKFRLSKSKSKFAQKPSKFRLSKSKSKLRLSSEIEMNAIVKDVMTVSSPICPERIEKLNSIAEFTFHMLSTKSCSPFGLRNCSTMVLYCLRKWLSVMSIITQFILLTHTLFDGTLTWGRRYQYA